jgi:hypothetical protein
MSTEMQNAFEGDMALINEDGSKSYVDNQEEDFEIKEQPKVFNLEDIE